MEKRILGRTQLPVTILGFGSMEIRSLNESDAGRILNAALDLGINYVDTSPDYGPSEEYIGKTLSHRRGKYFLASKCGCNIDVTGKTQNPAHIWSRSQLLWNIENSLRLLQTDHLDLWQLHGPAPDELPGGRADEVIQTMQELKQQGKVRWIGMSFKNGSANDPWFPDNYPHEYLRHFLAYGVFDTVQIVYGGMVRKNETAIQLAASQGLGTIIRGVVKQYKPSFPETFTKAGLSELCAAGESMSRFLLRFALNHTGISTIIIGTKNPEHLAENIRSAECGPLPADVYAEACRRFEKAGIRPEDPR